MRMKPVLLVGTIITLLAANSWAATTVKSSKSNSSEKRFLKNVTATTGLSGPSDTQVVYTTSGTGTFLLTEVCVSPVATGGIRLEVNGFGSIAHLGALGDGCRSFSQGILLPRNSTITCSTLAGASPGNYFCTIAGLEE